MAKVRGMVTPGTRSFLGQNEEERERESRQRTKSK